MGMMMLAQAVFDAISVMQAVKSITTISIMRLSKLSNPFSLSPIHGESPDASAASDRANPPPGILQDRSHYGFTISEILVKGTLRKVSRLTHEENDTPG